MEDLITDDFFGELKHLENAWCKRMDAPLLNSDGNLILAIQDDNKEGILDIQKEAYKTYLQNAERYKSCVTNYILEYYKWYFEEIKRIVSNLAEERYKDVITEEGIYKLMDIWYLFICRDGSFGYAFDCCWDGDNGLAVLLSEPEPRVISRTQLENLHKLNDPTLGLLVHDGKKSWKGLERHHFFGEMENLEIELIGGLDEGITPAQQKAYATYQQNRDEIFNKFSRMMLAVYVGSEAKADEMIKMGQKIVVKTILPKTLCIDREGNFGWSCYTEWDKDYVDILLSTEKPYVMDRGGLWALDSDDVIIDKEMGVFFKDYIGLSSTVIVRLAGEVRTMPFSIDICEGEKEINDDMRKAYRMYLKFNETLWEEIQDMSMDLYLDNYEEMKSCYDIPESLRKENMNRDKVMALVDITKLYMTSEGRIAWLCEFPTANDGLAFEFTDDFIDLITQPEII